VYRALAVASGALDPDHRPDLTNTAPTSSIGPFDTWYSAEKIVSMDPWGGDIAQYFKSYLEKGYNIQPTIAITQAHIAMPEVSEAIKLGQIAADGTFVRASGDCLVTKAAIEPVWYLPGVAKRFGVSESELRRGLFEHTGGMSPNLLLAPIFTSCSPRSEGKPSISSGIPIPSRTAPRSSPFAFTMSVTAPTFSAPTSVPVARTSCTGLRSVSRPLRRAAVALLCITAKRDELSER
jgi:hypothetical protein